MQGDRGFSTVTATFNNLSKQHSVANSTLYSASEQSTEYGCIVENSETYDRPYPLAIQDDKEYLFTPYNDEDSGSESDIEIELNTNEDENNQSGEQQLDHLQMPSSLIRIEEEEEEEEEEEKRKEAEKHSDMTIVIEQHGAKSKSDLISKCISKEVTAHDLLSEPRVVQSTSSPIPDDLKDSPTVYVSVESHQPLQRNEFMPSTSGPHIHTEPYVQDAMQSRGRMPSSFTTIPPPPPPPPPPTTTTTTTTTHSVLTEKGLREGQNGRMMERFSGKNGRDMKGNGILVSSLPLVESTEFSSVPSSLQYQSRSHLQQPSLHISSWSSQHLPTSNMHTSPPLQSSTPIPTPVHTPIPASTPTPTPVYTPIPNPNPNSYNRPNTGFTRQNEGSQVGRSKYSKLRVNTSSTKEVHFQRARTPLNAPKSQECTTSGHKSFKSQPLFTVNDCISPKNLPPEAPYSPQIPTERITTPPASHSIRFFADGRTSPHTPPEHRDGREHAYNTPSSSATPSRERTTRRDMSYKSVQPSPSKARYEE